MQGVDTKNIEGMQGQIQKLWRGMQGANLKIMVGVQGRIQKLWKWGAGSGSKNYGRGAGADQKNMKGVEIQKL